MPRMVSLTYSTLSMPRFLQTHQDHDDDDEGSGGAGGSSASKTFAKLKEMGAEMKVGMSKLAEKKVSREIWLPGVSPVVGRNAVGDVMCQRL